jgi:hypothetical protein
MAYSHFQRTSGDPKGAKFEQAVVKFRKLPDYVLRQLNSLSGKSATARGTRHVTIK